MEVLEEQAIGKEVLIIKIKQEVILSIVEAPAVATSLCWLIVQFLVAEVMVTEYLYPMTSLEATQPEKMGFSLLKVLPCLCLWSGL